MGQLMDTYKALNKTDYILLGLCNIRPMSGYQAKKHIEQSISQFWDVSFSLIYPSLTKLESLGLATRELQARGNRSKAIYSITPEGKKRLQDWLELAPEPEKFRFEILVKLYLGKDMPVSTLIGHLEAFRKRIEKSNTQITAAKMYADQKHTSSQSPKLQKTLSLITINLGEACLQALLSWADESLTLLKDIEEPPIDSKR